jgi:hypothetical protein
MKKLAFIALLALIFSSCGLLGGISPSLTTQSVSLQRGSSTVVGVIADTGFLATVTSAPSSGLEVEYATLRSNPKNVRGHLYITVLSSAKLGKQTVQLKSDSVTLTLEVNVEAGASVTLTRGLGRANTVAGAEGVITWIKKDGTVWQRVNGVSSQVAGISNARTVGAFRSYLVGFVGYAATLDGQVWTWSAKQAPTLFNQIEGGVLELAIDELGKLALATDGRVWNLKAGGATLEPDATDIASVRVNGQASFVGGGTQQTLVSRTFLKMDGRVQVTTTYDYVQLGVAQPDQAIRKITLSTAAEGSFRGAGAGGGAQRADGRVYLGGKLVHRLPAKRFESYTVSRIINSTNSTVSSGMYTLFDDGGLWLSVATTNFGENQGGSGTSSSDVTQTAVAIPNGEDVIDFSMQGILTIWTSSAVYVAKNPLVTDINPFSLELVELPDVRSPTL